MWTPRPPILSDAQGNGRPAVPGRAKASSDEQIPLTIRLQPLKGTAKSPSRCCALVLLLPARAGPLARGGADETAGLHRRAVWRGSILSQPASGLGEGWRHGAGRATSLVSKIGFPACAAARSNAPAGAFGTGREAARSMSAEKGALHPDGSVDWVRKQSHRVAIANLRAPGVIILINILTVAITVAVVLGTNWTPWISVPVGLGLSCVAGGIIGWLFRR